jgi:hypothetical protein
MKTHAGCVQGYNAQAVVTKEQILDSSTKCNKRIIEEYPIRRSLDPTTKCNPGYWNRILDRISGNPLSRTFSPQSTVYGFELRIQRLSARILNEHPIPSHFPRIWKTVKNSTLRTIIPGVLSPNPKSRPSDRPLNRKSALAGASFISSGA